MADACEPRSAAHESPRGPRAKPYSEACERNQDPILAILEQTFADRRKVLEIGSGTGQHGVHFAANLPHLIPAAASATWRPWMPWRLSRG